MDTCRNCGKSEMFHLHGECRLRLNPTPDPLAMLELYEGHEAVQRMISALGVICKTPHIRAYLLERDPMALKQVELAVSPAFVAKTEGGTR